MRMRANTMGFLNGRRIRAGEEFNLPPKMKPPKWAEPADKPATRKDPEPVEPRTLSEMARRPVTPPVSVDPEPDGDGLAD